MSVQYTIVQCVPDPIIDERINIGVIAFGQGEFRCRFVENWHRVRSLGVTDTNFLRDFAARVEQLQRGQLALPTVDSPRKFDEDALKRMIGSWQSGIRFSEPKGSLRDIDVVVDEAASRFLRKRPVAQVRARSRRIAATIALDAVTNQMAKHVPPAQLRHLVHDEASIPGQLEHHTLDVGVASSRWYLAMHGLSFELHDEDRLRSQCERSFYAISDIRQRFGDSLPMAVVLLHPILESSVEITKLYERARRVFRAARVETLSETATDDWVEEQIRRIPVEELAS